MLNYASIADANLFARDRAGSISGALRFQVIGVQGRERLGMGRQEQKARRWAGLVQVGRGRSRGGRFLMDTKKPARWRAVLLRAVSLLSDFHLAAVMSSTAITSVLRMRSFCSDE